LESAVTQTPVLESTLKYKMINKQTFILSDMVTQKTTLTVNTCLRKRRRRKQNNISWILCSLSFHFS